MSASYIYIIISALLLGFLANATKYEGSKVLNTGIEVTLEIDDVANTVDISMTGSSSAFFGVGFGGTGMNNRYAIIASGTNTVSEHILKKSDACQCNTGVATPIINVISDTITGSTRTVVLQRTRTGTDYTFPAAIGSLAVISAYGEGTNIEYHGPDRRDDDTITLAEAVEPIEMCCISNSAQTRWVNTCGAQDNAADCESFTSNRGRRRCSYIECALIGECNYIGSGRGSQRKCSRLDNQADCEANMSCEWSSGAPPENEFLFFGEYLQIDTIKGNVYFAIALFMVLFGICLYLAYVCYFSKEDKHKIGDHSDYKPLLKYGAV